MNKTYIHFCKINKALKIVCKTKEYWINVPIDKLIAHKYFYIQKHYITRAIQFFLKNIHINKKQSIITIGLGTGEIKKNQFTTLTHYKFRPSQKNTPKNILNKHWILCTIKLKFKGIKTTHTTTTQSRG